jgi:hypothetical protein
MSDINDAKFWQSENDLRLYVNNFYNEDALLSKQNGWGSIGIYGYDADNGSDTEIRYNPNTRMNGQFAYADATGWDWKILRDINYFLDHYKAVEEKTSFETVKPYVGEALFFRSLFYFDMLKKFGALPIAKTTVTVDSEILFAARSPRNEVVDFIMDDLDQAVSYLSARAGGSYNGRVTKETALALQARIALYEGTWEKYHAGTPFAAPVNKSADFLAKAASAASELMAMGEANGFPALDNVGQEDGYTKLFIQHDYSGSKEVLLWRRYQQGVICNNWTRYSPNGSARGLTKNLVDSYLCIDGTPISAGNPLYHGDASLLDLVKDRDPRLSQIFQVPDEKHYKWKLSSPVTYFWAPAFDGWDLEESCPTGYQIYKGHDYENADSPGGDTGTQALIYFRFGEVLLIYAEAKAELGELTQADLDKSINLLRRRVGMADMKLEGSPDSNFEFANLGYLIQAVRRERKVELACEGFRVDDIFRWAAAGELVVGKRPVGAKLAQWNGFKFADLGPLAETDFSRQEKFDERLAALKTDANGYIDPYANYPSMSDGYKFNLGRDYLQPIPQNELTLNPQLAPNNPGWQ